MPDYAKRLEVGRVLKEQLDQAYAAHIAAGARFDLIVKEGPSGLPHPDGVLRMQQAGSEAKAALNHYMWALKRFSDFTLSWTVPEDLLPPD